MEIKEKLIHRNDIVAWNENLRKWADTCNEQIILKNNNHETKHAILNGGISTFTSIPQCKCR